MDPFAGKGTPGDWGPGTPGDWGRAGESFERAVRAAQDAFRPAWIADGVAVAPGRLELLGNHIDYNGGPVLAAAIDRFVVAAVGEGVNSAAVDLQVVMADVGELSPALLAEDFLGDWRNPMPPPAPVDYVRG